jgi:hypothetical protein
MMQTAICCCEAGQPERAAALYREYLGDAQISHRDRGYFLSLLANASARAAEPDDAASAGREALTVAVETDSTRAGPGTGRRGGEVDDLGLDAVQA